MRKDILFECPCCSAFLLWGEWVKRTIDRSRYEILKLRCTICYETQLKEHDHALVSR